MFTILPTYIKGAFFRKVRGQIQIFKIYLQYPPQLIALGTTKT